MGGTTDQSVRPMWDGRFMFFERGRSAKAMTLERKDMTVFVEILKDQIQEHQIQPREQFIRQVSDEARPAQEVLEEQQHDAAPVGATSRFVP